MMGRITWAAVILCLVVGAAGRLYGADLQGPLEAIRAVGPDGKGSAAAARAWREVTQADVDQLPAILAGMDGANSLARNWLRAAVDQVLDQAQTRHQPLPTGALEAFVRDTRHNPQARRLAYELIKDADPNAPARFLPGMLNDPSSEMRRDAVASQLKQAETLLTDGKKSEALPEFQKALAAARDKDQVDKAAARLGELNHPVDLPSHYGLIMNWKLIGPFPNTKQKGVDTVYPPEQAIDLAASYEGKTGKVKWTDYLVTQKTGIVDLNQGLGKHLESVGYAMTEFTSQKARDVDIRLGCYTAFTLWLNGELILARGDAYTGMRMDHYIAKGRLKPGKNLILLKLCQDDPPPPLPKDWKFLLRICDDAGAAILSTTRPATSKDGKS